MLLNVPLTPQLPELPTGCEITAVTMMLQYKGANVDKIKLAREMPKHPWDPSYGYVGDPFTKRGWTVYPSALMGLVKKYAGSSENLTGKSNDFIDKNLSNNKPVVVWVSPMHGFSVHALVLTGYNQKSYYFNDPWTGEKDVKMSKSEFNKIWKNQSKRAISY
ncbi:C39 family peptidase [Mesobacillus maritimus]|uniref:C39 family peptidase n=1 Tax=Mesobacillus maritimus TaxID=1643336 RepID=A0ABS7K4C5_9BACI|nr:C39 family peptidase [Mesobacillus maritimus]